MKEYKKRVNERIKEIKKIHWFRPMTKPNKVKLEKQIANIYSAFHLTFEVNLDLKLLEFPMDWGAARDEVRDAAWDAAWDAARDAAWNAAWGAAWGAARDVAKDAAWGAAWGAARDEARNVAWDAAWDAAWDEARNAARNVAWDATRDAAWEVSADLLKSKGWDTNPFHELIKLWKQGFYVCGMVKGKFLLYYVPKKKSEGKRK